MSKINNHQYLYDVTILNKSMIRAYLIERNKKEKIVKFIIENDEIEINKLKNIYNIFLKYVYDIIFPLRKIKSINTVNFERHFLNLNKRMQRKDKTINSTDLQTLINAVEYIMQNNSDQINDSKIIDDLDNIKNTLNTFFEIITKPDKIKVILYKINDLKYSIIKTMPKEIQSNKVRNSDIATNTNIKKIITNSSTTLSDNTDFLTNILFNDEQYNYIVENIKSYINNTNLQKYYKELENLLNLTNSDNLRIKISNSLDEINKAIVLLNQAEEINRIQTDETEKIADLNKKLEIINDKEKDLIDKSKDIIEESQSIQPGLSLEEQLQSERIRLLNQKDKYEKQIDILNKNISSLKENIDIIEIKNVELEVANEKLGKLYEAVLMDQRKYIAEKQKYENEKKLNIATISELDILRMEQLKDIEAAQTQINLLIQQLHALNGIVEEHKALKEQQKLLIVAIKHFQYKLSKHATTTEAIEQIKLENAIIFDALVYNRTSDELDDLIRAINEEEKGIIEEETPYTLSGMIGGLFSKGGFPIIIPPSVTDESILRDIDTHRGALSEDDVKQLDKIINERRIKINQEKSTSSAKAPQRIEFRENLNKIINKITNVPETKPELVDALEFDDNRDNLDINSPNNMYDEFDINSPNEILDDINAIDGYSVFKSIFANPEEKLLLLRHFAVNTVILGGAVGSLLLFAMIFEYSIYVASAMVNKINFPNTPTSELVDIISETTGKPKDFIINAVREVNESGITIIVPTAPTPSDPVFSISDIFGWIGKQAGKLLGYLLTMLIAFSKWLIEQGFKILKNIAYGIASGGIKSIIYLAAIFITFVAVTAKSTITNNNIIP